MNVLSILQTILASANIIIIGYGFYKFLNKPHNTLEEKHSELKRRVDEHDLKFRELENAIRQNNDRCNDRFHKQDDTNEVVLICTLALVDFELSRCAHDGYEHTADLLKARDTLRSHLASK
jgi:hypothetical protein